ncbi:hypothetical protein N658DRAFT_562133 [Parathielavia hyrcaniae]|uniref:BAG domain-containing protein n=1 Tax=Parathielavia hyrcaniae TaxID=113614 RepID=A0AAN6PVQ3_9PEZI|nr:hypothetical protein N658DRAFT_562133 [Parathielavia hyrcaniae]
MGRGVEPAASDFRVPKTIVAKQTFLLRVLMIRSLEALNAAIVTKASFGCQIRNSGASFANLAGNLTSALAHLSASLQPYLDVATTRLTGATDYLQSTTGLSPIVLYTTAGAALLLGAIPAVVARNGQKLNNNKARSMGGRYGFSNRWAISPFSSQDDGVPDVTEQDYSYITSAELEDRGYGVPPRSYQSHPHISDSYSYSTSAPSPVHGRHLPEDDVLLIKHQAVTYPEHFPAYSIGDAQLRVSDVRERLAMIMDLSDRQVRRMKLYYKGRRLKKLDVPIREYGVKNNSELLMVLGDPNQGSSGESSEEVSVVGADGRERYEVPEDSPRYSPRVGRSGRWDDRSPRDSSLQVGQASSGGDSMNRAQSRVRQTQSPGSAVSAASAPAAAPVGIPGGPIEKVNAIAANFRRDWLPRCLDFAANPPRDHKTRGDEHRKLSELVMQKTLLKLDEIETSAEEGARARRKELVVEVQTILNKIDAVMKAR